MQKKNSKLLTFSWFFFLFMGMLLIGNGYTGYYLTDFPDKEVCLNDFDCVSPEVCCKLYQEDSGVCDIIQNCAAIQESSKDKVIGSKVDNSLNSNIALNTLYLYSGSILILLAIIGFIYNSRHSK